MSSDSIADPTHDLNQTPIERFIDSLNKKDQKAVTKERNQYLVNVHNALAKGYSFSLDLWRYTGKKTFINKAVKNSRYNHDFTNDTDVILYFYDSSNLQSLTDIENLITPEDFNSEKKPPIYLIDINNSIEKTDQQVEENLNLLKNKYPINNQLLYFSELSQANLILKVIAENQAPNLKMQLEGGLSNYIKKFDDQNFKKGFHLFFVDHRANNRKINYYLAQELKNILNDENSGKTITEIFSEDHIIELTKKAYQKAKASENGSNADEVIVPKNFKHKINSRDLKAIINMAQKKPELITESNAERVSKTIKKQ